MQYIMTFIWSAILVTMLNYVVGSILGAPFDFMTGIYISVVVSILLFVATAIIPSKAIEETGGEQH